MTNRRLMVATQAEEARPASARIVALKDFRYKDMRANEQMEVRRGDVLGAGALRTADLGAWRAHRKAVND